MKKLFMFMLMAMILSISGWSQETVTIGTGTTTQDYVPTYTYYGNSATQTIYLADEIGMGGEISSISYYAVNNSTTRNVVIYMGETTLSTFSSVGDAITDLTQVYSGSVTFTAGGWTTITFTTPFVYSGTDNLVVGVRDITNSYDDYGSYPSWQSTSAVGRSIYSYQDDDPVEFSAMSDPYYYSVSDYYPNIQLNITPVGEDFCYAPATITVGNVETNAATVSWTMNENNPDASVNLQYALSSVDWDDEEAEITTVEGLTGTEYEITGLTGNTTYKVRIQADCGSSISSWKNATFTTACDVITDFPWEEGFENTWTVTSILGGVAPNCWAVYNGGAVNSSTYNPDWMWGYSTTSHNGNGAAACYTDYNYGPENHNDWLVSPLLSLDGNKMLSFYAQRATSTTSEPDEISIWISDEDIDLTAPESSNDPLPGFTQIYQTDIPQGSWQLYEIPLAGYSGNRYIAFVRRNAPTDGYYLRLDDVKVEEMPECTRPINLATLESTENSVTLSWDEVENAESYTLYYKNAASSEDYIAVEDVAWGEDGYVLEGLTASTTYEWTLAVVCGGSELPSLEVAYASTTCATITEFPWEEGFELDWLPNSILSSTSAPLCWAVYNGGATSSSYDWMWGYSTTSHSGNGAAACYTDYATSNHNDWLVSPLLSLDGNKMLSFYAQRANSSTSEPDEISIWISDEDIELTVPESSNDPLPGFTQIYQTDIPQGSWQLYEIPLAGYSGNRYIAFVRRNAPTDGYYLRLDDVKVDELPECTRPTITSLAVTPTDVTIAWTSTGENFQIAYGTSAGSLTNIVTMEDDIIQAADEENTYTATIGELTPNTQYYYKVIAICDETTQLETVEKTFSTPCNALTLEDLPKTWDLESDNVSYGGSSYYLLPSCWSRTNSSYPYAYNYNAHGGSYSLYWSYTASTVVLTPVEMDANTLELSLWARGAVPFEVGVMTNSADESTFTPLHSIIPTNSYTLYTLSLLNYQGEGHFIAIRSTSSSGSLYIDDITLDLIPECSAPSGITATSTEDAATLTWTSTGEEFVVYMKADTDEDYTEYTNGIEPVEGVENTYTITINELQASTVYSFYIETLCGEENNPTSNVGSIRTACLPISDFPWTETFETLSSSDFGCWTEEIVTGSSHWTIDTYGGSKVAYRSYTDGSNRLISPVLDITGLNSPYLSYNWEAHYDSYNNNNDSIYVYYRTSSDAEWVELAAHGSNDDYSISDVTQTNTIALPEASETYQIAFLGVGNNGYGMAIDNVVIENISCAAPTSVALENATQESLEISWEGEANFIEYKLASSDEWIQEPVTGSPHTITGLLPASIYNVRISRLCDDETYVYSSEETFATACSIVVVTDDNPWVEDFSSEPMCWTLDAGQTPWIYYSSNYYIGHGYGSDTYEALTPIFDISGLENPMLTFLYHIPTYSGGASDELHVYYRADEEETWTLLSSYTTYTSDFTPANIVLETEATNIQFKFTSIGGGYDADGTYLDDVSLLRTPSCLAPTDLVVSNVAGHSATLAWTSTSETVTVAYKSAADETFTEVTGVSENPYVLSGLAPETQYTVKVGVTCEDNTTSWSTTNTFTTDIACPAPVVTISNITETSVTISYTGDAEEYELKFKTLSDEDWTTETITENPYTLENLSPSTTYTVELRANCGDEDGMSSAGTTSFTTACVTITDFPYTESFEGNSLGCWLSNPVDAIASNWTTSEYYYSSSTAPADGSYCAYLYLENNDAYHHAQLLSPTFDLSSIGNPTLTFSHIQKVWISDQDTLGLYYRTSTAGEWTYLTSWSSNINTWQNETITLPEPSAEYQLMFLGAIHYGYGIGIDNITIDGDGETPEPVQPTVVTNAATSISQTSAILNGAITSEGNQTITARGFEWKLATATDYTVVSATGTTMTATLTGLTANTTYTYKAFATTALGTVYGSELTFTTLEQGEEPCTPTASTTEATICAGETYEFNGQTYTTAGTYTATLVNAAGCDSTATLVLTVNQPTSSTTDVTVCYGETYEFNGQTYNATGTYTATLTNAAGCDSVATLNLTVRPENAPIEETVTLNNDELPYTWRGEQYTEFGTYTVAGEDENGCPQEYTLTLVHNSSIAEVENEYSIALYPNPTSENATLSVKGLNEEATVIVTDQAGRVISTTKLALGQETMEVETTKLASGVYYIRIQTANSVRTEKLIRK